MECAMIFNGHTHETIAGLDDITMAQLQTMYADGVIGNQGVMNLLGTLTNGVFNYIRPGNAPPYKLANIMGLAYDYLFPPLPEEYQKQAVNDNLLAFMVQAPGFSKDRFEVKHG